MKAHSVAWIGAGALFVLVVSCGTDGAGSADVSADALTDGPADMWVPTCPGVEGNDDDYDYDSACIGNVGCSSRDFEHCTTSCVLCDGPRCVRLVDDDSCWGHDDIEDDPDTWVPTCPGVEAGYDHYDAHWYDDACAGNVGCTGLTCEACTTSCVLCDGERCVEAVADDSCMDPPPAASGWTGEPVGGVPDPMSEAVLALSVGTVALADPGVVPAEARWLDGDGNEQTRTLVAPVVVVADRALVAGNWVEYNNCTGEKRTGELPPTLFEPVPDEQGVPTATWANGYSSEPWSYRVAWIRVLEAADGARAYQWLLPSEQIGGMWPQPELGPIATRAMAALPAEEASALGTGWAGYDWAALMP